jgi:hypothetical protein
MTVALSATPFARDLLCGPPKLGTGIGQGYALIGNRVLAVTTPGALRMPNGIEADLRLVPGETVLVGGGELRTPHGTVALGRLWDPRPTPRFELSLASPPRIDLESLAGRGPGLTPLGDDLLVGYLAAAALAGHGLPDLAERAAGRTTALSGTLLLLAAQGCLPEAAHRLLEDGDPEPLQHFGATSGRGIAFGLALYGALAERKLAA